MGGMETTVFAAFVTFGGAVITYLLREIARLKRQKSILERIVFQNREAMESFLKAREQDGSQPWDG